MPKLIVMVGLSASGKSTIAKELAKKEKCLIISTDKIREHICPGGVEDQSKNEEVFKIFHRNIREKLTAGYNVIADATNITIKSRAAILRVISDIECEKIAYLTTKTYEDCIKDNVHRDHPVPEHVIKKQMYSYQIPFKEEGWKKIAIDYNTNKGNMFFLDDLNFKMKYFDQKNPHHTMNLYEHCSNTFFHFLHQDPKKYIDHLNLYLGAYYHDVSKLFTQTFDENGIAHYYNHENHGCYYMLSHYSDLKESYYSGEKLLNNLFLINYHMMPFNWNSEKAHNKWKRIFGEEKYQMLLDFHKCDKAR